MAGNEGGHDQQRLRADRLTISARIPRIFGVQRIRNVQFGDRLIDQPCRLLDRRGLIQAKADGNGGEIGLVVEPERGEPALGLCYGRVEGTGSVCGASQTKREGWVVASVFSGGDS